jgi:trimeric autotransporter adhesin
MDATRVSSLAGPASNDTSIQPWQSDHAWSRHSRVDEHHDGDSGEGDRFTSSSQAGPGQDAQDAGLFTVSSVAFFSAAATFFLAQTSPSASQASTVTASAPSASSNSTASTGAPVTPVVQSTTPAPATSADSDASPAAVTSVTQPTTSAAVSSTPTVSSSTAAPAADSNSQNPLQALNNSLAALGLSQQEIQAFDQIASFIQAVSPAAFADLVSGLQALAQQATQAAPTTAAPSTQSDSTTAAPSSTGSASDSASTSAVPAASTGTTSTGTASPASASNTSAAPAASATPASSSGVQIEELVVQFSEVQVQGTVNSPATGTQGSSAASGTQGTTASNSFEFDAFKLQIEEVTLTVPASASQPAQAQTPNQAASASSTSGANQPATTSSSVEAA